MKTLTEALLLVGAVLGPFRGDNALGPPR